MPSQWAFLCLISRQLTAEDLVAEVQATGMVAVVLGTGVPVVAAGVVVGDMGLVMAIGVVRPGRGKAGERRVRRERHPGADRHRSRQPLRRFAAPMQNGPPQEVASLRSGNYLPCIRNLLTRMETDTPAPLRKTKKGALPSLEWPAASLHVAYCAIT